MRKKTKEATTTDGPEGVSNCIDPNNPRKTDRHPMRLAVTAMDSGVRENRLAAAAGMIRRDVISNIPMIFMPMAITSASNNVKTSRIRKTGTPSACASSS